MSSPLKLSGLTEHNGTEVWFQHYITLDWDSYPEDQVAKLEKSIRHHTHIRRAWVRESIRKGHLHVIAELDKPYMAWVLFFLRLVLGDDRKRIRWDKMRRDPQGVLWDYKKGRFSGDWVRLK